MTRRKRPAKATTPDGVVIAKDGRRMSPNSLANLRANPDNLVPGAGAWRPGDAPTLRHGARTKHPQRSPEWSPAVEAAIADLSARVGTELRDGDGDLQAWAVPSIEAVAILRVAAWRAERFASDREAKGVLTGDDIERVAKVAERYHRGLEREALTLRSRIEATGAGMDLARLAAEDFERERRERGDVDG